MLKIGLTGGIATGKSTVSRLFRQRGIPIIDADQIARKVIEPNGKAFAAVREAFPACFDGDRLNRPALGREIFHDDAKRQLLNQLMHPAIREEMVEEMKGYAESDETVVIFDIPLLFEGTMRDLVDYTVVVYCREEIQLMRLMERNGLTKEEALARIHAQIPIEEKKHQADYLINNNGALGELPPQVDRLVNQFRDTKKEGV
ncbi:MAG: dephospho-CoA kinase [Exiguobacterium sp.]|uniref:dephospho-CoA kinase n=1 Tax=Exiguobacterium sp. AB2 TaxID=1484479 RepID=UPI0004A9716C|nr:dephospho-CoA kinase [Exiguobacterium sp. AB2]KDN57228.1 dephospho-CoA kinase [Exiguobacterium sp. AB2]MDX5322503.1 dephospho-CoA kinase [Exiguobacterium sp.]MDX5424230.1 dephospho-CoA kinase [Exiguobacterium sp.]MDX6771749.1 dephospho-CoA kinase [Exiguobacterium sp.]